MNRRIALPIAVLAASLVGGLGVSAVTGATIAGASPAPSFDPVSVTFISTDVGWALGRSSCATGTCLALRKTTDGGRAWSAQPLPSPVLTAADKTSSGIPVGGELNIRFANSDDGWIFGSVFTKRGPGLTLTGAMWSTHDGGIKWQPVAPPKFDASEGSILDVEAAGGQAYLLAQSGDTVVFERTPQHEDAWSLVPGLHLGLPAGGAELSGAIVLQGSTGWVVEGNDRGTTGAARLVAGRWQDWAPPCANLGGTEAFPAAMNTTHLAAVCIMGGFASPMPKAAPRGATLGSAWLYVSSNGGATFSPATELAKQGLTYGQVLAYPAPGTYFLQGAGHDQPHLQASFDGGQHWSDVYTASIAYLGFTTPTQGVGIAGTQPGTVDGPTSLVMTYNGGHSWSKVTF
jgi:photosystem II stability/assembly factor-like uncharacterized protein